jgi:hypothetical protein
MFLAAALLCAPSAAWAWGCEGHQIVALIAERNLTPHALAMVKQILKDGPIDPSLDRYCKNGSVDAMADASTWADDIRNLRHETAPWHYVDIPLGTSHRDLSKFCGREGCLTRAITGEIATLRATGPTTRIDPRKRAEALRFLIHFVGDLHQPLHAVTNNDEGGNCVPVAYFSALPQLRNPVAENYTPNLHAVWDTSILERIMAGKRPDQVAIELERSFRSNIARWQQSASDINQWAWESYGIAQETVYGKLPVPIRAETPQPVKSCANDNHISTRMLNLHERLGQPYQDMAVPIVQQQLAKAGARLAHLLEQLWP